MTYFGPIILVLGLSLMKELWDHINTIIKDNEYNKEEFILLEKDGSERNIQCKDIETGHLIKLSKDQRIPVRIIFKLKKNIILLIFLGRYGSIIYFRLIWNCFC